MLLTGRLHATRGALQGDALTLLAFGGSASSPSSAAVLVEMQLVLRCGRCSGAPGCRRHSCPPAPAAHLPLPCVALETCCCSVLRGRRAPSPPSRTSSGERPSVAVVIVQAEILIADRACVPTSCSTRLGLEPPLRHHVAGCVWAELRAQGKCARHASDQHDRSELPCYYAS